MSIAQPKFSVSSLRNLYRSREARPDEVIEAVYDRILSRPLAPTWISVFPREVSLAKARALASDPAASALPLYGIPFAIKDNIDVAGLPTTAACPAFAYQPAQNAAVVEKLIKAGAIPVGKTNMDQFATGLVGTRSPFGKCSCIYDERYISGGSSSGSALAVALGLVSFSLGTDTAGSGRVPAACNNLVGLKPTRGLLSTRGVVPACRTLDCVSIFSQTCENAQAVWRATQGFDAADPFSRAPKAGDGAAVWLAGSFRFGVPAGDQLEFFGDTEAATLFQASVRAMESLGGRAVYIDLAPFRAAASLLYSGPWVAERYAAVGSFVESHQEDVDPVVRQIILNARSYTAVEAFQAEYRLREIRRATEEQWSQMDVLLLPTAGTMYTHQQIAADPVTFNTNLGYYTNFVNLLDLAAVSVPAGFRANGLPFGISLIGPGFSEEALITLAGRYWHQPADQPTPARELGALMPGCLPLAVVGAHLTGQPLNGQLIACGARLMNTCRTAPGYRLYALSNSNPRKPALVRDDSFHGPGIEVEVWMVPEEEFGRLLAEIPPPLGIGTVTLDSGWKVRGFICEPYAIAMGQEITSLGGWRAYLAQTVPG